MTSCWPSPPGTGPRGGGGLRQAGLPARARPQAIRLPLPRPVLYDAWHLTGVPKLGWMAPALGACPLIHAPSVAVPPAGPGPPGRQRP